MKKGLAFGKKKDNKLNNEEIDLNVKTSKSENFNNINQEINNSFFKII